MNIVALFIVLAVMVFFKSSLAQPFSLPEQGSSLALGFIMFFAFLCGKNFNRIKLPQITGYILAGFLAGPHLLRLLTKADVGGLQLLDGLALSLIALTAGGEMELRKLRGKWRAISSIVIFQTGVIIGGVILFGLFLQSLFPFFSGKPGLEILAVSLLLGTLATATSPSTTIAIITESRARGKYTDLVLSAAVVKDFVVIIFFAFSLSFSKSLIFPEQAFDFSFLLDSLAEIGGSVLLGIGVGGGIILYLKFVRSEIAVFILGVAFFTYQISHAFGWHPLLVCLLAGFLVKNFSSHGEKLITALERSSVPVFIIFFAISGASIDLGALKGSWFLAFVFVIWRGILKFFGTYLGGRVSREDAHVQKRSWAGFVSQAGVALGMAIIVEETFPSWGGEFKALVLAVIAINQIVGPILLQRFLERMGEAGKKSNLRGG